MLQSPPHDTGPAPLDPHDLRVFIAAEDAALAVLRLQLHIMDLEREIHVLRNQMY